MSVNSSRGQEKDDGSISTMGLSALTAGSSAVSRRGIIIPSHISDELLVLYAKSKRFVTNARYYPSRVLLSADLTPLRADYGLLNVPYYTAAQLAIVCAQGAYLLGGMAMLDPLYARLPESLYQNYAKKIAKGECYYMRLNLGFHDVMMRTDPQCVTMQVERVVRSPTRCLARMSMNTSRGKATGDLLLYFPVK